MGSTWRYKTYFILFLVAFSGFYLVPTFLNFKAQREDLQKQKLDIPWYHKVFPADQINLGLDLQGGIYLELEVLFEDAIHNQVDLTVSALERFLEEKEVKGVKVTRVAKSDTIEMEFSDEASRSLVEGFFLKNYSEGYHKITKTPESVPETAPSAGLQVFYKMTDAQRVNLKDQTLNQAIETIRNRVDRYGVSEPAISRVGDNRVAVELPGETDPVRALSVIMQAGKLEFRLVDETPLKEDLATSVAKARAENKLLDDYSRETVEQINDALKGKIPEGTEVLFQLERDPKDKKITGGKPFLVKNKADVTGDMLKSAQVDIYQNKPVVSFTLKATGKKLFGELTEKNVGKNLAIILDGNVMSAPNIEEAIYGGSGQIKLGSGNYDQLLREAQDLVVVLREGALPASLKEATKTIIGPSLGKSSIQKGISAMLIAGAIVIIFMIFYYKLSGVVADLALGFNVLFILTLLAIFGATLTMPGLAGIILTMGMAVDANIIIFERIKEELAEGKKVVAAVEAGFSNAMSAIVDSNLTTFFIGIVLYQYGTGAVRGFAVTLMIGIATTMLTAIMVSRLMMEYLARKAKNQNVLSI
ncbi:MAG: protein translocase subunit SecD [Deltaproteobacteria bacterium]|nr:protein translocase subunit SecD [Deltaproteobacteria bacterium]